MVITEEILEVRVYKSTQNLKYSVKPLEGVELDKKTLKGIQDKMQKSKDAEGLLGLVHSELTKRPNANISIIFHHACRWDTSFEEAYFFEKEAKKRLKELSSGYMARYYSLETIPIGKLGEHPLLGLEFTYPIVFARLRDRLSEYQGR